MLGCLLVWKCWFSVFTVCFYQGKDIILTKGCLFSSSNPSWPRSRTFINISEELRSRGTQGYEQGESVWLSFMSPVFSFPYSRHRYGSGEVLDVILSKALIWFRLYRTQSYGNLWVSVCLFSWTPSPRSHPSTKGLPLVFRSLWAFSH